MPQHAQTARIKLGGQVSSCSVRKPAGQLHTAAAAALAAAAACASAPLAHLAVRHCERPHCPAHLAAVKQPVREHLLPVRHISARRGQSGGEADCERATSSKCDTAECAASAPVSFKRHNAGLRTSKSRTERHRWWPRLCRRCDPAHHTTFVNVRSHRTSLHLNVKAAQALGRLTCG